MSEYQYYEWQTVDRLLTEAEQEAVRNLSSHIEVSSSRAVVTYSWGDFKHEPRNVLARFFDAHLYLANWGSRRLMFRFPPGLVSRDTIEPYCVSDRITFGTVSGFDILSMDLSEEDGGNWIEGKGSLSGLLALRNDVIQGDYRSLYLAWLKAMSVQDGYRPRERKSREPKPPVPAGLKQLSSALKLFVKQFDVPAYFSRLPPNSAQNWRNPWKRIFGPWRRSFCAKSAMSSSVGLYRAIQPPELNSRGGCCLWHRALQPHPESVVPLTSYSNAPKRSRRPAKRARNRRTAENTRPR